MNATKPKSMNVTVLPVLSDDERLAAGDCLWGILVGLLALPFVAGLAAVVACAFGVLLR